jgi:hypothetical protein
MTTSSKTPPGRRQALRTLSSGISSCAGAGGAVTIMTASGNIWLSVTVLVTTQVWLVCELYIKVRYTNLHNYVARKAADNPNDRALRTLLIDLASTCPGEAGERLPVRACLKADQTTKASR